MFCNFVTYEHFTYFNLLHTGMSEPNFETLLGKNISEAPRLGSVTNLGADIYSISEPKVLFLGRPLQHIAIGTKEDKVISSIYITFQSPNDPTFYSSLREAYGEDYEVMVKDKIESQTTSTREDGEFKETLQKREILLKEGNINDTDIAFIIWIKKNYQIEFFPNRGVHFNGK